MDSDEVPPPPPEEELAPSPPPPLPPTSPPPSMQTSNQMSDLLDFDSDVGGLNTHEVKEETVMTEIEIAKGFTADCTVDVAFDSPKEESEEGEIHEVNECGQHKRKAAEQEPTNRKSKCIHTDNTETNTTNSEEVTNLIMAEGSESVIALTNNTHSNGDATSRPDHEKPLSPSHKQEFEIIDDIGSEDEGAFEFDSDMDEDEIDALLDEGLQNYRQANSEAGSNEDDEFAAPIEREKIVLKEHVQDPFDILPESWVAVTHNSGMPVYLHKQTRVCTLSRPYFLGPGSARKHDIPLSAITCLKYRRELDQHNKQESGEGGEADSLTNGTSSQETDVETSMENNATCPMSADGVSETNGEKGKGPSVRVECLEKYNKDKTLGALELRAYCERLFEFQTITVKKYKTWKDRRKHHKLLKLNTRPSLPSNTKLITCPILINKQEDKPNRKKEFVLNPAGKSDICILHEYVQHAMRVQPRYIIKELENAQTPYSATVIINGVEYGAGYASSKKAAKNEAAKVTLGILIPELKKVTEKSQDIHDLSFFDEVKIEDPRVHDLCHKAGQPGPFQILCECLRRNFGMGDTNCQMDMKTLKHQKSEFTMRVGKHSATVICKNKREGKQLAAQAILQKLHPHIHNWGSLLRLYGTDWKAIKEKEEELSVTSLHGQSVQHMPNTAILNKLKEEMKKLQMRRVSAQLEALDLASHWCYETEPTQLLSYYLGHPSHLIEDQLRYKFDLITTGCSLLVSEAGMAPRGTGILEEHFNGTQPQRMGSSMGDSTVSSGFSTTSTQTVANTTDDTATNTESPTSGQWLHIIAPSCVTTSTQTEAKDVNAKSMQSFKIAEKKSPAIPIQRISGVKVCPTVTASRAIQTEVPFRETRSVQTDALDFDPDFDSKTDEQGLPVNSIASTIAFIPRVLQKMEDYDIKKRLDKIFVEMGCQTEPQPETSIDEKTDETAKEGSDTDQKMDIVPASELTPTSLVGVQAYAQALAAVTPLMSGISPYILSCPPVVYPAPPPTQPISGSVVAPSLATTLALTVPTAAPPEKPPLPSYKTYWRSTPSTYTPQEVLVSAGIVPPEQRCWKKQPEIVAIGGRSSMESSKTRTPSPMPVTKRNSPSPSNPRAPSPRPPRTRESSGVRPLMSVSNPSGYYPNPYHTSDRRSDRSTPDRRPTPSPPPSQGHGKGDGKPNDGKPSDGQHQSQSSHQEKSESHPNQPQQPAMQYTPAAQGINMALPPYPIGSAEDATAYYQQQYLYGQATTPYAYAYPAYTTGWNWH